jgi:predicted Rossmann fold flavoprotein
MSQTVAIIGGGAAGLMAAATIAEADPTAQVVLIERNDRLGKKVVISGGGRCNVTTGIADARPTLLNYPRGDRFLTSAMYAFPPAATVRWFEEHGVPLYCQPDQRVFPQSDDGHDIVAAFEKVFRQTGVKVLTKTAVSTVTRQANGQFAVALSSETEPLTADAVILATGGQAYRHTGSTGDGYAFATALGHSLTQLAPGLTALKVREKWVAQLAGIAFPSARHNVAGHKQYDFTGPFIFTHQGLSGPATFAFSSLIAHEPLSPKQTLSLQIDLLPEMTLDHALAAVRDQSRERPGRSLANLLAKFVPHAVATVALERCQVSGSTRSDQVRKDDLRRLLTWIKAVPLTLTGRVAGDEFITVGGIPHNEIDPQTMQSRVCPGLFFAGEIMDIDGFTGGFNLQASWATGRLAGLSAITGPGNR